MPEPAANRRAHVSDLPLGWTYNPSSRRERWPLLCLAGVGLLAAIYTSLSQIGVISAMWDPFFGSASSFAVTHSALSRSLPVPDGVLGVVGYLCDLAFGWLGGQDRWRSKPWIVLAFALIITGIALVSLALTVLQGTLIGHWCTVCLVSATVSTLIFGLGIGEALASLQYLARARLAMGWRAAWRALWGDGKPRLAHAPRVADGLGALG